MRRSHQKIIIPVTINGGGTRSVSAKSAQQVVENAANQALIVHKRPVLAEMVARVKREVEEATTALGKPKIDWDPVVELAMIAANATGKIPMEFQLFALDRVRKYWYAELREQGEEGTPENDEARRAWAQRMGEVIQEYERRFRPGVTDVEPQVIEPKKETPK